MRVRSRIGRWRERTGGDPEDELNHLLFRLFDCSLGLVTDVHRRSDMSLGAAQVEHQIAYRMFRKLLNC